MMLIHIEYMVCRSLYHLLSLCEKNCLKNIYHLCNVRHLNSVTVLVKDVQVYSCNECISYRVLLIQKSRIGSRLTVEPCSPLIHNHAYLVLLVILVHDCFVILDKLIHIESLIKCLIPHLIIEIRCASLMIPSTRMCIVMK